MKMKILHVLFILNNLYGWAMIQPLPVGNLSFVDHIYTDNLHDSLLMYQLAPDKYVACDVLSPYCKKRHSEFNLSNNNVAKLVPNFKY